MNSAYALIDKNTNKFIYIGYSIDIGISTGKFSLSDYKLFTNESKQYVLDKLYQYAIEFGYETVENFEIKKIQFNIEIEPNVDFDESLNNIKNNFLIDIFNEEYFNKYNEKYNVKKHTESYDFYGSNIAFLMDSIYLFKYHNLGYFKYILIVDYFDRDGNEINVYDIATHNNSIAVKNYDDIIAMKLQFNLNIYYIIDIDKKQIIERFE